MSEFWEKLNEKAQYGTQYTKHPSSQLTLHNFRHNISNFTFHIHTYFILKYPWHTTNRQIDRQVMNPMNAILINVANIKLVQCDTLSDTDLIINIVYIDIDPWGFKWTGYTKINIFVYIRICKLANSDIVII